MGDLGRALHHHPMFRAVVVHLRLRLALGLTMMRLTSSNAPSMSLMLSYQPQGRCNGGGWPARAARRR